MKAAFQPHKLSAQNLRPLNDSVIVVDMEFDARITSTGLILPNDNGTSLGIRPRWGQIYAVGPEQKDVAVGQWICVAHGRWTRGIDIEEENGTKRTIRKIDPKDILLTADERPQDDTMSTAIHEPAKTR